MGGEVERALSFLCPSTKALTPLGHAVRLVDGDQAQSARGRQGLQAAHGQPRLLGRDVDEGILARPRARRHRVIALCRPQEAGRHAPGLEGTHLVLHQGDERADHDGRLARPGEGRDLVAQGLARTGRHHDQGVRARQDVVDDRFLAGPEG